jgi:L-ribulokinase
LTPISGPSEPGIQPGTLVKIIGTSTCDVAVASPGAELPDIPGHLRNCGWIGAARLLWPGGRSVSGGRHIQLVCQPYKAGRAEMGSHEALTQKAQALRPGQSGLLALDWNNGNRTILVDQRLTGLLLGQTLHTRPEEIYRALIEATAFGALTIINRFEEYGVKIDRVVNCGGISEKNQLLLQIYADVTGREMLISRSAQTCALGAAIAGAVTGGVHPDYLSAQAAMCGVKQTTFKPRPESHAVYTELYGLYMALHDAFGTKGYNRPLEPVMKKLLGIKDKANA